MQYKPKRSTWSIENALLKACRFLPDINNALWLSFRFLFIFFRFYFIFFSNRPILCLPLYKSASAQQKHNVKEIQVWIYHPLLHIYKSSTICKSEGGWKVFFLTIFKPLFVRFNFKQNQHKNCDVGPLFSCLQKLFYPYK